MAEESKLQPVFVPSLLDLLVNAERIKGAALTAAELHDISENGACIIVPQDVVERMEENRGFRDIRPENCLAEWNRCRGEKGFGYLPKLVFCLCGGDQLRTKAEPFLEAAGVEYEFRAHEPQLVDAFQAAHCRVRPSLAAADIEAISQHTTVLYFLSEGVIPSKAGKIVSDALRLGQRLLEEEATGLKCDSSGIAHSGLRWRELAARCRADQGMGLEGWHAALCALVRLPLQSSTDLYSCGMHLLGQPDMIVSKAFSHDEADVENTAAYRATDLFNAFGLYLLAEVDDRGFVSGHTFSAAPEAPRYRVIWEPCEGYAEDDFFFNPYGRWRFVAP